MTMKVDVHKVREVAKWLSDIDTADFSDIQWFDGDDEIKVSKEFSEDFSSTGLRPTDFALLDLYKRKRV